MRTTIIVLLLCLSLGCCKYSYSDKCYRYEQVVNEHYTYYSQYYFNRKGEPLSNDHIIYVKSYDGHRVLAWSYYYHYVTNGCTKKEEGYDCSLVCESIWFKVWNATAAGDYGKYCDKGLIGKYGNILEHGCDMPRDPFEVLKGLIGNKKEEVIHMNGKKPLPPDGYHTTDKCIWEYNILGLWSIVTLVIVCVVIVVVLVILVALVIYTQRHRANKRRKLDAALIQGSGNSV